MHARVVWNQVGGLRIARVMTWTIAKLDEAVACTQALIADQQACIDRLDADGGDSSRQQEFLGTFKALLAVQDARRQRFIDGRRRARTRSPRPAAPYFHREVA